MRLYIKLILFSILLTTPLVLVGQNYRYKPAKSFSMGVNAGALWSKVDFSPSNSFRSVNNRNIVSGISFKYMTEKNFGLLMEFNLADRGWAEEFEDEDSWSYSRKLRYIEIPLLSHASYGDKFRVFANAGPNISFLIDDKADISDDLKSFVEEVKNIAPNNPFGTQYGKLDKTIDYGILAGVGFQMFTKIGNFSIEGRYYLGLGDIFKNTKADYFNRSAFRTISAHINYSVYIF